MINNPDGHFIVSIALLGCAFMFSCGYAFAMAQKLEDRECSTTIYDQFHNAHVLVGKC